MPFIPHTADQVEAMLEAINVPDLNALFDEIPQSLMGVELAGVPAQRTEMAVGRLLRERAARDGQPLCFAGAGAYEHHIPAAVWEITTRGEFYSAYTPYQAEASQGTLQVIYEYQTMMARLTGMDVSNASLYDGASALAEAALMAVRANRKSKARTIVVPKSVHPAYRRVLHTIVANQGLQLVEVGFDLPTGTIAEPDIGEADDITAVVIPQPNFFGQLEEVDQWTDWAHARKALVIALVNPLSLALLKPPGEWGQDGADIVCGDGQPLGVPISSGGPYYGLMCCKQQYVRQMPGRIVGRTVDLDDKPGFTLTLQAREQHIRRAKATSNICTNQGLLVTASTIHMALLGPQGLYATANACHQHALDLRKALCELPGVEAVFDGPGFHEFVVRLPTDPGRVLSALADRQIVGGVSLVDDYPELGNAMLVCATETKTEEDFARFKHELNTVLEQQA